MRHLLIAFCILIIGISNVQAEPIKVLGKSVAELLTEDPKSMFHAVLLEAGRRAGLELQVSVNPGKRALEMFNQHMGDILAPVQLELMHSGPFKVPVIGCEPVSTKNRFIYTKSGSATMSSLKELDGKRVGLVRGYRYGDHIDHNESFTKIMAANVGQLMKMLDSKRVDAIIAFPHSIKKNSKMIKDIHLAYDKNSPVTIDNIAFAFHDNERGNRLRDAFSKAIIEMRDEGTLARMTNPMEVDK